MNGISLYKITFNSTLHFRTTKKLSVLFGAQFSESKNKNNSTTAFESVKEKLYPKIPDFLLLLLLNSLSEGRGMG